MTRITLHDRTSTGVDVHFGEQFIGSVVPAPDGWEARPSVGRWSVHPSEDAAITAVVHAHTGGGYIVHPGPEVAR